jgi:WD repeat and SOF domain-containing protein 1
VLFSPDAKFVLSGSDDTNIRIWKAQASDPLRTVRRRSPLCWLAGWLGV